MEKHVKCWLGCVLLTILAQKGQVLLNYIFFWLLALVNNKKSYSSVFPYHTQNPLPFEEEILGLQGSLSSFIRSQKLTVIWLFGFGLKGSTFPLLSVKILSYDGGDIKITYGFTSDAMRILSA